VTGTSLSWERYPILLFSSHWAREGSWRKRLSIA